MTLLTGSAKIRMDDKGRLALPQRYREALAAGDAAAGKSGASGKSGAGAAGAGAAGLVLTMHPHGHLSLYPQRVFERISNDILAMPNIGYMEAHLQEVIIGCAEDVTPDGAGRIMVHSSLRERAGIGRVALLFGIGESIHIWDEAAWEKRGVLLLARLQDEGVSEKWRALKL